MNTQHTSAPKQRTSNTPLWASAFILLALLIIQAGRTGTPEPTYAQTITSGRITAMAGFVGTTEEAIYLLDQVEEQLYIYTLQRGGDEFIFGGVYDLEDIFPAPKPAPSTRRGR